MQAEKDKKTNVYEILERGIFLHVAAINNTPKITSTFSSAQSFLSYGLMAITIHNIKKMMLSNNKYRLWLVLTL